MKISGKLVLDQHYFKTLMRLLDNAQQQIDIIAFSFAIGSAKGVLAKNGTPYQIAQRLAEIKKKLKNKMSIRLYIEGERETADRNHVTGDFLTKAGVKVKYGATHAKGFLIDEEIVLLGSTNLTHQSITKNNEANIVFKDKRVFAECNRYFTHLWSGGRHGEVKLKPPMLADGDFKDALIELINSAKKTLDFSIYFFHHSEIEHALIDAHKRGVKIFGFVHEHKAFAMSYVRRTIATAERLKKAGIRHIHFGPTHLFSHSKFIVADKKEILLGTGNWLQEDVEVHPQLHILFENATLGKKLCEHLRTKI